jgi:hypothetical protein
VKFGKDERNFLSRRGSTKTGRKPDLLSKKFIADLHERIFGDA